MSERNTVVERRELALIAMLATKSARIFVTIPHSWKDAGIR
jgi:hypothetical protein